MSATFRYNRHDYRRPPVQLTHVDLKLDFFDDRVEGVETLHLTARETLRSVSLDAQALEIGDVQLVNADGTTRALDSVYFKRENRLEIVLPHECQTGEALALAIRATCRPTHNVLDGLYYDTTPPGAPPQMISQCQQWGFQRIMPVVDDCTAKCTWRTTLEGSSRYTHLITNGDVCRETNPDGVPVPVPGNPERMRITYVNTIPMPPYLFIAAAGTWDVLADSVMTDFGRTIRLEYLVPPGKTAGARLPMAILQDAVRWHARRLGYDYRRECYRTICMEKSNFGGMENVGNTTIITEAALIDEWTPDRRLVYAYGVILHEFEHNHCGSDVTMETPFDMWLNEAFTVNIEREYLADKFGTELMRLSDLDSMRGPLQGPLAVEDAGKMGRIVREGFNHPDEVVDGVTYVKAPEVLGMLRELMGAERYEEAVSWYFTEYNGGNADTDQFLAAFRRFSDRDLDAFFHEWLFTIGYPSLRGAWRHEPASRRLVVALSQRRRGGPGGWFTVPFHVTGVDAAGAPMPSVDRTLVLDCEAAEFVFEDVDTPPAFLDWNSGGAFYGAFEDATSTPAMLAEAALKSPFLVGRVDAMRRLADREMAATIADPAHEPAAEWLALFPAVLADASLPPGIRARLLTVSEEMLDRDYLPRPRERNAAARALRRRVAASLGEAALLRAFAKARKSRADEPLAVAIPRRSLVTALAMLLAEAEGEKAVAALVDLFETASCIGDRLAAAQALLRTASPRRQEVMAALRALCRPHVAAYGAYLQVVAGSPAPDVFAAIAWEESDPAFRMDHPGHSRSLYAAMAANNAQLWTEAGLAWAEATIRKLAPVNEYVALVVVGAFQLVEAMAEPLRDQVLAMLERLADSFNPVQFPSIHGRLAQMLERSDSQPG